MYGEKSLPYLSHRLRIQRLQVNIVNSFRKTVRLNLAKYTAMRQPFKLAKIKSK